MKQLIAVVIALCTTPAAAQHAGHDGHDATSETAVSTSDHMTQEEQHSPEPPAMATKQAIGQAPPPAAALSGPAYAADGYYAQGAMAHSRAMMMHEMGGMPTTIVMIDRLELQAGQGAASWAWEGGLRSGGDIDRLRIKTEGEANFRGVIEDGEVHALWSHAIGPWFDLQTGLREKWRDDIARTQFAAGVEGLAPYMFDVSALAYVSTKGEVTAKIEADIDQRLTQRLIVQSRVEANFAVQDVAAQGLGSGLTSLESGLRLRYEIRREFAPYVGVEWQKEFGRTADYSRLAGGDPDRVVAVVGLRAWF